MNGNPFYPVPEFPDFPAMTPEAADEAFPQLLADARAAVDRLEQEAVPTWEGFVRPLGDAVRPLHEAWRILSHLLNVCNSEAWRAVEAKYQPQVVTFLLRIGQSRRFYELAKETAADTPVRRRILEKMCQGAELSGVALPPEKQARFNEIQAEMAQLGMDFRDTVLDATKAFSFEISDATGLPAQLKAMTTVSGDTEKGPWKITLEDAVCVPFMKHCPDRAARERLYRARATRAPENAARIDRILALRREEAELLGFATYADLSFATKSAPSVAAAEKMIAELADASGAIAERENEELKAFKAAKDGTDEELAPWDLAYWTERLREARFDYSEEELSCYFNLPTVLDGLFDLAHRLFGVTVESADWTVPVWQDDVRFFRVRDEKGEVIAHFYFDPYSRPETKSDGAWMGEIRNRDRHADGNVVRPLAYLCCNLSLPDAQGRVLMRFTEVETLFHEFGHALQQMLTRVNEVDAAGTSLIEWDAVEIASQFMENWCLDRSFTERYARKAETNEPLPAALREKVRAAKNFRAANATLRQLSFASVDLELHGDFQGDANALKEEVFRRYRQPFIPEDRFLNAFGHIFAGGYAAGYYGYKWSEVMSADVFGAFEELGTENEAEISRLGRRYRETFLALGGGTPPMEVFRQFRGRDPSVEALLRQQGLVKGEKVGRSPTI